MWKRSVCISSEWVLSNPSAPLVTGNTIIEFERPWCSGIIISVPIIHLSNGKRGSATLTMLKTQQERLFTVFRFNKTLSSNKQALNENIIDASSSTSSETPTLHLPNFKWRHLIGALNQMVPELLQLFLKFRINGPDKYNNMCYQDI